MTKIAILATAAFVAFASPALAKLNPNGISSNALAPNALTDNALTDNALNATAVIAHAPPSDFCAQSNATIAHAPPSDFCAHSAAQPAGLSLGGTDGMKVMSIELSQ